MWPWLRSRLAAWSCAHDWSSWYISRDKLFGPYGTTEEDINERMCRKCSLRQRIAIKVEDQQ